MRYLIEIETSRSGWILADMAKDDAELHQKSNDWRAAGWRIRVTG